MISIRLCNLGFSYPNGKTLFSRVTLEIEDGSCIAITGQSGTGKSTFCNCIAGIIPRNIEGTLEGDVQLFDKSITSYSLEDLISTVGIVFQDPDSQLFAPTVEDEIAFGPENLCLKREEIAKRIEKALHAVGMEEYRFASPSKLSGGQKQLVSLASVLSLEPKILLFDEALSQLDDVSTKKIKDCIVQLKNEGKTIVMIEHDEDNLNICDAVYKLEDKTLTEVSLW